MSEKVTFNEFFSQKDDLTLSKTRKKMNKKCHKGRHYGHAPGEEGAGSGVAPSAPAIGESLTFESRLEEIMSGSYMAANGRQYVGGVSLDYEEEAQETDKVDVAKNIFMSLYRRDDVTRSQIIDHIKRQTGVTDSTAVSYYQRFAKQTGIAGTDREENPMAAGAGGGQQDMQQFNPDDQLDDESDDLEDDEIEEKDALIRTVKDAHLIRKEQTEDGKFEELWIFNVDDKMNKALKIRRDILAGTDIGENKTGSEDGEQTYTLWTVGNIQYVHIKGLPN